MTSADLPALLAIADIVHPAYPEDPAVFAERLALYPEGCLVMETNGRPVGYIVSHPWLYGEPPKLNSSLRALPIEPTTYYIHDIALLPETRGIGGATRIVTQLTDHAAAEKLTNLSLVAVNDSVEFWSRHGFDVVHDHALVRKLRSYDVNARFMVREIVEGATTAT